MCSITAMQQQLERGWNELHMDSLGSKFYGSKIVGKECWIGAYEVRCILASIGIETQLLLITTMELRGALSSHFSGSDLPIFLQFPGHSLVVLRIKGEKIFLFDPDSQRQFLIASQLPPVSCQLVIAV